MSDERAGTACLLKAIEFASRKHSMQRRKDVDASPYINHPIAVAHILTDAGGITDLLTLMAAVLHDTVEDTKTTPTELEEQFGETVRKVDEEMTDDKTLDKVVRKQLRDRARFEALPSGQGNQAGRQDRQRPGCDGVSSRHMGPRSQDRVFGLDREGGGWLPRGTPRARTALRRGAQEGKSDARNGIVQLKGRLAQ